MYLQSILNSSQTSDHLWTKPSQEFKECKTQAKFAKSAYKISPSTSEISERFFKIKEHFLYYTKTSNYSKISGVCDLRWATVEFLPVESEKYSSPVEITYTILIVKNGRFTNIFLENEEELEIWRNALRSIAIMTDISSRFQSVGKIGRGGFSEVKYFLKLFDFFYFFQRILKNFQS